MEEKRRKRILLLAVFAILNLCFYGIFCVEHFAADTYLTEVWGWEKISKLYWQNGEMAYDPFVRNMSGVSYWISCRKDNIMGFSNLFFIFGGTAFI